ncbi:hypothetical protein [Kitasatospora sp. NPDC004531]
MFATLGRALVGPGAPRHHLTVDLGHGTVQLSPQACRTGLYGPYRNATHWTAIWREATSRAQRDPRSDAGIGRLLVVWLAVPGMNRSLYRLINQFRVDRADLEAEAALGVLAALDSTDADAPSTGGHLIGAGVRQMWSYAVRACKEVPVLDLARFARDRNAVSLLSTEERSPINGWDLEITPPAQPTGLSATLRFTQSRQRLEGERLGALAHDSGLSQLVFRARRHEEEDLIGTLALRPAGGTR